MKVLHICSGYPDTQLYQNLVKELDSYVDQVMYVPYNEVTIKNKRIINNAKNIDYIFSSPFNKLDRVLYYPKIKKIYNDIVKKVDLKQVDIIHAHFLFSNGGPAYRLKKKYGIEYIVAVRNTDINYFFKYAKHLRSYGIKILEEAKSIIFLSPSYKEYLLEEYIPEKMIKNINDKSFVIPNGIDEYWFNNLYMNKSKYNKLENINLLYVGELNKNKNVEKSIKSLEFLRDKGYSVTLDIIGTGGLEEDLIERTSNLNYIKMHGYINDKNILKEIYRKSDIFIMPSMKETFGLVYIEAMSQGLPVIFSKGQGIDGYFQENEVGVAVLPSSVESIAEGILAITENYNRMYQSAIEVVREFKWSQIAEKYLELYK